MIYTFPFILSTHCLMKVWMHHRYDLSDLFFSSSFFFFHHFSLNLCLSHMNLVFTPDCQQCQWIQTLAFAVTAFFFIFAFPSAGNALCLECRRVIARQPKVTLIKTKGSFCLSALQPCPIHPPIPAVAWFSFLLFFLEAACTDSHADFVIGYRLASWAAHTLTISLSWSGIFSDLGPGT